MKRVTSALPVRRSTVVVPAHNERLLAKGLVLAADVLLLDLQDSVPQTDESKTLARDNVAQLLRRGRGVARETSVRVNGPLERWIVDDLRMVVAAGADSVTVAQTHGLRDLLFVEGLIDLFAAQFAMPGPAILLEVETPATLCELESMAHHSRRIDGLCVAPYDYAIEVGAAAPLFDQPGEVSDAHLALLRPRVIAVARAHGWTATDAVLVSDPKDAHLVRQAVSRSRQQGFDGCAVLHPSMLALVNEGFSPTTPELAWARQVVASAATGAPMRQPLELARRLIALDQRIGQPADRSPLPARRSAMAPDLTEESNMTPIEQAQAFTDSVHADLRKAGLWLADSEFVQAIAAGSASREAFVHWGRQFFVAIEQLHKLAHSRPRLATIGLDDPEFKRFFWENRVEEQYGAISNTAGHLELLIQLLESLGVSRMETVTTRPTPQTAKLIDWARAHVLAPEEYLTTQVAIGMLESMNPDSSLKMAQGAMTHYGLSDKDVRFMTVHITADAEHGEVAIKLLQLVPPERWEFVRQVTLEQAGLVAQMWNSAFHVDHSPRPAEPGAPNLPGPTTTPTEALP